MQRIPGENEDAILGAEPDTVAYSGPHLAELLAASGENAALSEIEVAIETTLVLEAFPARPVRPSDADPESSSSANVAYTLAPRAVAELPGRVGLFVAALALTACGMLIGVLGRPSLSLDPPHASRALARQAERHEMVLETSRLLSPTLQKVATVRPAKVPSAAGRTGGVAALQQPRELTGDGKMLEDMQQLLAARLGRRL